MKSKKLLLLQALTLNLCLSTAYSAYTENPSTPPRILTAVDILKSRTFSNEPWAGLDPRDYSDMNFYEKGNVHIKGVINDYSPESGFSTLMIGTRNMLTDHRQPLAPTINPDGTFAFDVAIDYPQFSTININNVFSEIFLNPGDTLNIVTTTKTALDKKRGKPGREYFGFTGKPNDAVAITLLADSLKSYFNLFDITKRYSLIKGFSDVPKDSMEQVALEKNTQVAAELGEIVSETPRIIGNWPVNKWVKDVVAAKTYSEPAMILEDIELCYRNQNPSSLYYDAEEKMLKYTEGKNLDQTKLYSPRLPYLDVLYCNPLLMTCNGLFNNRWSFNRLFKTGRNLASNALDPEDERTWCEEGETVFRKLSQVDEENLKKVGIGNCFAAQAARTFGFISSIRETTAPDPKRIQGISRRMTDLIRHLDYEPLIEEVMNAYTDYVKDVMISQNLPDAEQSASILLDIDSENDILREIIAPYLGNVIYLDFWGIYCGPCRAGMIDMKPLLEHYSDSPFKVLYIANAGENREACEKWLQKENIKGEHIFVSPDNWNRLRELFRFDGIPHEVLIDKQGNVIANKCHIRSIEDSLLKKAISEIEQR